MSVLHLEGKPDLVLALCLGFSRKQVRSHGPKGEVCNYLESTRSMIGLIDDDPTSAQPTYIKNLKTTAVGLKYNLRVVTDEQRGHKIVIISPKLEDWVVAMEKHCDIRLNAFRLPNDPKELHKKINSQLEQFEKLIRYALQIGCEPILHLQRLLTS